MSPENNENYSVDRSREILESAFNEKVTEEYNAPHELRERKKTNEDNAKQKPGYQKSNKELRETFTSKELKNLKTLKISAEAGDVGGPEDDIAPEERIKLLREKTGRKPDVFNRLESLKRQVELGWLGAAEAEGELEKLPSKEELEKNHREGQQVLDDIQYVRPKVSDGEERFDKVYEVTPEIRERIIDKIKEWKENYDILKQSEHYQDRKSLVEEGLRPIANRQAIAEQILGAIQNDPTDESLYVLFEEFDDNKMLGLYTDRLGYVLKKRDIVENPRMSDIRKKLYEMLAHEGQSEAFDFLFEAVEEVKNCPFEEIEDMTRDEAIGLRIEELEKIINALETLRANIENNPRSDEEERENMNTHIHKLEDEIHNNIEEMRMDRHEGHPSL